MQVNFIEKMRYSLRACDPQEGIPPSRGPVAVIYVFREVVSEVFVCDSLILLCADI